MSERDTDLKGLDGFVVGIVVGVFVAELLSFPFDVIVAIVCVGLAWCGVGLRELARRRNP